MARERAGDGSCAASLVSRHRRVYTPLCLGETLRQVLVVPIGLLIGPDLVTSFWAVVEPSNLVGVDR